MPSNTTPLGALPARFRRPRVLLVGCGDVGVRLLGQAGRGVRLLALTSNPDRVPELRQHGALPLVGDLDRPATLARLAGLAQRVVHLAPPPGQGRTDPRTRHLVQALNRRTPPAQCVYASTTGVYGDCAGQWVREERLRGHIADLAKRLEAENTARVEAERKAAEYEKEIERLTALPRRDQMPAELNEQLVVELYSK